MERTIFFVHVYFHIKIVEKTFDNVVCSYVRRGSVALYKK